MDWWTRIALPRKNFSPTTQILSGFFAYLIRGECQTAGIRKIRLHDLRHTFGSLPIQNGVSIVNVKEQMGHSSIQVMVDIYGHPMTGKAIGLFMVGQSLNIADYSRRSGPFVCGYAPMALHFLEVCAARTRAAVV